LHQIVKVLKIRNFFIFVLSQTVSQFGDKLDYIALIGLIGTFAPKQEPILLSQLAICFSLPVLLFGPVSGVLVDRWNRKRVMVICDLLRGILVALIPPIFLLSQSIYPVFLIVFFVFLFTLFFNTARLSIIPDLVRKENVLYANSVATFVGRFATLLGMVAGGFIIDWGFWSTQVGMKGWQAGFLLDSATFFFSAAFLATITVHLTSHERNSLDQRSVLADLKEAWRLVWRVPTVTYVFTSILILVFAASAVYVFVIPLVQHGMKWGTKGVGLLGGGGGLGLLVGALGFGIIGHRVSLKDVITVNIIVFGLGLIALSMLKVFSYLMLFSFVGGISLSPIFISQETILHHTVPNGLRGRIFSSREWMLAGSFALFSLINSLIGNLLEPILWLKMVGIIVVVLTIMNRLFIGRYAQDPHLP